MRLTLLFLTTVLFACSTSTTTDTIPAPDADTQPQTVDAIVEVQVVLPDLAPQEIQPDLAPFEFVPVDLPALDIQPELPIPACQPGEGCFLDKCTDNAQCQSGWCVEHMGDGVCSQNCVDECPQGWSCKQVGASDPDLVYVCVSNYSNLCKPCLSTEGCQAVGGAQDVCVAYGDDGSFCGGTCADTADCPWGFSCLATVTVDGIDTLQCVADAGACPCTAKSAALSLWTNCQASNEMGTCTGKRVCTEDGLTECDALFPATESCNGVDDDCDDFVDEPDELQGDFINLCDDGNACTDDNCNGTDGCEYVGLDEGECIDGNPCTVADHCVDGECIGNSVECNDDNPCTDDSCDGSGGCLFSDNAADCDDLDPCTVADECSAGGCSGTPVPCDCKNPEDCDALEDGDLCNGTLFCTLDDWPYECAIDPATIVVCPEPEPGPNAICTKAVCDPATGDCTIVPDHEGFACDDGSACTIGDSCKAGVCSPGVAPICNDGNPCTKEFCDPEIGCLSEPQKATCTDNDSCTTDDFCLEGECISGAPLDCDDNNVCSVDDCLAAVGCVHLPSLNTPCDNGNLCTQNDQCSEGFCAPGVPVLCDDQNLCTTDTCNGAIGCLYNVNTNPCDDGNVCTLKDTCEMGSCVSGANLICTDNNPCTDDTCDGLVGCLFPANDDLCDDINPCTTGDHCSGGMCTSTGTLSCDDDNPCTDDSCDPLLGCLHELNALPCNDGDACTTTDLCTGGICVGGSALNCNDGNICTDDSCNADTGCAYGNNKAPCSDGDNCTIGDTCSSGKCWGIEAVVCDDLNPCTDDSCDPAIGCLFEPNEEPCSDDNACTVDDQCTDGECVSGAPLNCQDNNVCTNDGCDSATGCTHVNNDKSCDDSSQCTLVDSCVDGACVGVGAPTCDDSNPCTDDGCEADKGCVFTPNTDGCDDGVGCTVGDTCADGSCVGLACSDVGQFCVGGVCKDSPCEGFEFGGFCWYAGSLNTSCNSICSGHGGCAPQGLSQFSGSKGCQVCQAINPGKACNQHGDCKCAAVYPGLYTSGSSWCGYNSQDCTTCSSVKQCGNYSAIRYCPCIN